MRVNHRRRCQIGGIQDTVGRAQRLTADRGPEWRSALGDTWALRRRIHPIPSLNSCLRMDYLARFQGQLDAKSVFEVVEIDPGDLLDPLEAIRQAVSMQVQRIGRCAKVAVGTRRTQPASESARCHSGRRIFVARKESLRSRFATPNPPPERKATGTHRDPRNPTRDGCQKFFCLLQALDLPLGSWSEFPQYFGECVQFL